ncbi:M50 family metallopeptidase [Methanolobus vulcani]|jgi:Zn-dependent protease|uniref:Zinc metalloprotease n=1 Tax=Methanolobus vulcani TaxID=38026 RepID=A0A7Z8KRH6_9EURY|nr:CBS domain-containing protein [Methanolobus vulcani]TQD28417.1 CBS domain-containing protein [Methanolobus vulcani]
MNSSYKIGSIMGIPIKVHITFLFILPIFALVFATNPQPYGFADIGSPAITYGLSLLTTILLFVCVLLHELGHSYIAKSYGVEIKDITLMLLGGVSSMEEIPREPSQEFKMAFAGPLVSLIIGFGLLGLNIATSSLISSYSTTWLYLMVNILATINIILALFNLIPAFPMDGGRILRSMFAKRMSYIKATHYAASVGKMFAFMMALIGVVSNLWLLLIAFFVYIGASEEDKSTTVTVSLERYKVGDIMSKDVISVEPEMTVEELSHFMFENKHLGYPVIKSNSLKGIVTFTDIRNVMPHERYAVLVSDVMTKDVVTLPSSASAAEAFKVMTINNIGRVLVMDDDIVKGILSRTDLMRSLMLLTE